MCSFLTTRYSLQDAPRALWGSAFLGRTLLGIMSEQWKQMEWQGSNPSIDFKSVTSCPLADVKQFSRSWCIMCFSILPCLCYACLKVECLALKTICIGDLGQLSLNGFLPSIVFINSIVKCWLYKQCVFLQVVGRQLVGVDTRAVLQTSDYNYHCCQFCCQLLDSKKTILILETCWHQPKLLTYQMFWISLNNLFVQDLEIEYKGGPLDYLLSKGLEQQSFLLGGGRGRGGIDTLVLVEGHHLHFLKISLIILPRVDESFTTRSIGFKIRNYLVRQLVCKDVMSS